MDSIPNSICLTNGNGNHVNRHNKSIKIASPQWILCVWLVFILSMTPNHVCAKTELHIGGIFPIGGKGGWQGMNKIYDASFFSAYPPLLMLSILAHRIEGVLQCTLHEIYVNIFCIFRGASMSTSCWIGAWGREQQLGFASRFHANAIQQWQRGKCNLTRFSCVAA